MHDTLQRLRGILVLDFGLAPERLVPEATLDALGLDSLRTVELMWLVEEAFGLTLTAEAVPLQTLADVTRYINRLLLRQDREPGTPTAPAPATARSAPTA